MQNPFEGIQQLADQLSWVNQVFGPESMAQMRDGMRALKESGERPRGAGPKAAATATQAAGPPLEIYVTADTVVLCAMLPGLASPAHVSISLLGPKEILLEAYLQPSPGEGMMLHQERFSGYCHRIVTLPAAVMPAGAVARYSCGVVECRFPRQEPGGDMTGVAVLQVNQP